MCLLFVFNRVGYLSYPTPHQHNPFFVLNLIGESLASFPDHFTASVKWMGIDHWYNVTLFWSIFIVLWTTVTVWQMVCIHSNGLCVCTCMCHRRTCERCFRQTSKECCVCVHVFNVLLFEDPPTCVFSKTYKLHWFVRDKWSRRDLDPIDHEWSHSLQYMYMYIYMCVCTVCVCTCVRVNEALSASYGCSICMYMWPITTECVQVLSKYVIFSGRIQLETLFYITSCAMHTFIYTYMHHVYMYMCMCYTCAIYIYVCVESDDIHHCITSEEVCITQSTLGGRIHCKCMLLMCHLFHVHSIGHQEEVYSVYMHIHRLCVTTDRLFIALSEHVSTCVMVHVSEILFLLCTCTYDIQRQYRG